MLTKLEIIKRIKDGRIIIEPFEKSKLGTNSYDLDIAPTIFEISNTVLDCAKQPDHIERKLNNKGFVLEPGRLYLAATVQKVGTMDTVPKIEGKSSIARLGICVHQTAGSGDIGFNNHWTLELSVIVPVIIYPFMPIAQMCFHPVTGKISDTYDQKKDAKYNTIDKDNKPTASKFYLNSFFCNDNINT